MNFDYQFPYTSTRLPLFARNIVSTSHPLAAQAGLRDWESLKVKAIRFVPSVNVKLAKCKACCFKCVS